MVGYVAVKRFEKRAFIAPDGFPTWTRVGNKQQKLLTFVKILDNSRTLSKKKATQKRFENADEYRSIR